MSATDTGAAIGVTEVVIDGHSTAVASAGHGDVPVLFLHAIGLDWRMWRPVLARVPARLCAVAIDLPGFGRAVRSAPASLDEQAHWVLGLLDRFDVDQLHVVGLSYGGALAQVIALTAPDRVLSLSLVATIGRADRELFEARARAAARGQTPDNVESTLQRWFTPEELCQPASAVQYARRCLRDVDPMRMAQAWRVLADHDVIGRLPVLSMPVTMIAGEHDVSASPQAMGQLAEAVRHGELTVLPGAAHMIALEQPRRLAELVFASCLRVGAHG